MTVEDKIKKCIAQHPDWDDRRIANAAHARMPDVIKVRGGKSASDSPKRGKSLSQFKEQFDIKLRIHQGIKKYLQGVYMTEQELRDACGISTTDWRRYADESEFDNYKARVRGQMFWAAPKMLAEMKSIAGIIS